MPKPFFVRRPSGLYARFLVPADLRHVVGSRFLVRPLYASTADAARLTAACMGMALSKAFRAMRSGELVSVKKVLGNIPGDVDLREWSGTVRLKNGAVFENVAIESDEDARRFNDMVKLVGGLADSPAPAPTASAAPLLSVQAAAFVADLETARRSDKNVLDTRHALKVFLGVVGDRPLDQVNASHIRHYLGELKVWPSNATKRREYRDLSVSAILKKARTVPDERRLSSRAQDKYRDRLEAFFNAQVTASVLTRSPLAGIARASKADRQEESRRGFTSAELRALFNPGAYINWADKHPHRWWGPILGLYSGARTNEIAQLYVDDVEAVAAPDGSMVMGFHVRKKHVGQRLKTPSSLRFVPLHPDVLAAGFLAFVADVKAAGHVRLFPHLPFNSASGYGDQLSDQFRTYVVRQGLVGVGLGFHAFRHAFATVLANELGVDDNRIGAITGHNSQGGVLRKVYIDPPTLLARAATVAQLQPPVTLLRYEAGQFSDVLEQAHDLPVKWAAQRKKLGATLAAKKRGAGSATAKE
jgi:integrase